MRRILVAAALTLTATLTQCSEPPSIRGNDGTPCPRPEPRTSFAGKGEVIDRMYSTHPGCADKWFLKVAEASGEQREVWFETSEGRHATCDIGQTWNPSFFGSDCT